MKTTSDIRTEFLSFFGGHAHKLLPSSPLVPHNDPTLMFANAGMNQFKDIFTGMEKPPVPPRAATSQKVVRAGGKHNDLDNVGYTARHLTFFEMLGNFSFGDYFKEQAITFAWELLTRNYGIDPQKLGFTVYHTDDEAFALWKKITGCDERKIIRIPTKDNFWAMGDTGPCGPCSEIFYDHGEGAAAGSWSLNADGSDNFGDRFIEIWNLVFMQYEQVTPEQRVELPKPSIDTGMGLERFTSVLQGVHNVFEIDLFQKLIEASVSVTGARAEGEHLASHRVIADHLRSSCFLIADGVLPSNEGRGYVLRRIMRRAMRHLHLLGGREPMMYRLVPALVTEMGQAYPELGRAQALIVETLKLEESRFRDMLDRGLKLLEEERAQIRGGMLPGQVAFKLYDTFGFPLDLTQDILRGHGQNVDEAGFHASMEGQRAAARAAWKGSGGKATGEIWFQLREKLPATEFLGYHGGKASAQLLAIVKDGAEVAKAESGDTVLLIFNQTPFYGESGGQVGDIGTLYAQNTLIGEITDTTKPHPDLIAHQAILQAPVSVDSGYDLAIDGKRRDRIRANHSATHLLHASLRKYLGHHVTQKGSLVDAERLRFDFSQPKALSPEELRQIEDEVNRHIWENHPVGTRLMTHADATADGAMALFGEKYADEVRVLNMGLGEDSAHFSLELCGGTHVARTGDIGLFKILSEGAIASGIRRIEATTQRTAFDYLNRQETQIKEIAAGLKIPPAELPARVESLSAGVKRLERELAEAKKKLALGGGNGDAPVEAETIGNVSFLGKHFDDLPPKELRGLAEAFLKPLSSGIVVVTSAFEGKGSVVVAVSPALVPDIDAAELVKLAVAELGGQGGGGRPEMAQGGGPEGGKGMAAIDAVRRQCRLVHSA